MAGRGPQTYLKRQKEQQRAARALAKRTAKQERRAARTSEGGSDKAFDEFDMPTDMMDQDAAPDDAAPDDENKPGDENKAD
jgi:hypothetical protein